ncbi:MAG: peptidoglycan DD-metalloendopeptidase family protein [bacterium]
MKRITTLWGITMLLLALAGCGGVAPAPVINKSPDRLIPPETVVKSGESIYSISWKFGLDYLAIAKWNGIKPPYQLNAGQRLRLRPGAAPSPAPAPTVVVSKPLPPEPAAASAKPLESQGASTASTTKVAPPKAQSAAPLTAPTRWQWPAKGELVAKYSRTKGVNGIRIAGPVGSPIKSTAAGDVVYVGEGLRGYGKLIIVKHSDKYLSAYAHNRKILVAEGERIRAGQQIAEMGNSGADRTMLHFEIRVNGKPQDPLKFLKG